MVKSELEKLGIDYKSVELGEVQLVKPLSATNREKLKTALHKSGLEVMNDKKAMMIEKIINIIVEMVHYTPCIAKAPIYGATRWIKNNSLPLIQITDRKKDYKAFWFTFCHELAHILKHGKKDIFIDGIDSIKPDKEKEDEADSFSARMLLSEKERNELFKYHSFDKELILELSKKFKRHPGIIVAQVQRQDNHLYKNVQLNSLNTKVEFTELSI
jgi:Zn-dependent peptidase ImmA (M78 family)